jgi:tetratricopeptide (TPR) repeat protein
LYAKGVGSALFNAMMAWYGGLYDHSITVATHVLDDLDPFAGEAYRIRAFSHIELGKYSEARSDLRQALASSPWLGGAKEPLAALDALLDT